ncbi:MAG: MYXO-CTERM sorting domain-containing protein [Kofleriaceae bacterium]
MVTALGPETAATVVPTLEVYPFYLPDNVGKMYQPMPSFAVFLSHEGKLDGIPVGKTDKIKIRASTEEFKAPEPPHPQPPHEPKKKSGCGCETTGTSSTSWLLVGVVIVLLRRRRRR